MKLQPLRSGLLVRRDEAEDKMTSGIVLPGSLQGPSTTGTVVEKGPEARIPKNSKVFFREYGPVEVEVDEEKFLVLSESDVLGVVKDGS